MHDLYKYGPKRRALNRQELLDLYVSLTDLLMPRIAERSRAWAVDMLDAQKNKLDRLTKDVIEQGDPLHFASLTVLREVAAQTINSAKGNVLHADEAMALAQGAQPHSGGAVARFERIRFRRAVLLGGNKELASLMAHPDGVRIVKEFAESVGRGQRLALATIDESRSVLDTIQLKIGEDDRLIWRFPPAVAGAVASLGLASFDGFVSFSLAWAKHNGRPSVDQALEIAGGMVLALELVGGPLVVAAAELLDLVLSAIGTVVGFARELEQDQAAKASAFASEAQKIGTRADWAGTAAQGMAAIAAALALPDALSTVARGNIARRAAGVNGRDTVSVSWPRGVPLDSAGTASRGTESRGVRVPGASRPELGVPKVPVIRGAVSEGDGLPIREHFGDVDGNLTARGRESIQTVTGADMRATEGKGVASGAGSGTPDRSSPSVVISERVALDDRYGYLHFAAPHFDAVATGGQRFVTDLDGRPLLAEGWLERPTKRRVAGDETWVSEPYPGTQGSHLIAASLGGPGSVVNLVPATAAMNRSMFSFEDMIRRRLRQGEQLYLQTFVKYVDNGRIPTELTCRLFQETGPGLIQIDGAIFTLSGVHWIQ